MSIYNKETAFHYNAFRPPLHQVILEKQFKEKYFKSGLDFGCGTGESSLALQKYCDNVFGVDPSGEMIAMAKQHPKIKYEVFNKTTIPYPEDFFEVITLAGSWYYAYSQNSLDEMIKVSKQGGKILIYDFKLELTNFYELFNIPEPKQEADYYHQANFDNFDTAFLTKKTNGIEEYSMTIKPGDLAHILLAIIDFYAYCSEFLKTQTPFDPLQKEIRNRFGDDISVKSTLFWSGYSVWKTQL